MSVNSFRENMRRETITITNLCRHFKEVLKKLPDMDDEISGDIMVAIGQAELLVKERFTMFSGLINDCELKTGAREVTCQDLQGFWDIIYFQVEDVMNKFNLLKSAEKNGWVVKKAAPPPPPPSKQPAVKKAENKKMGPPKPVGGNSHLRAMIQAARQKAKQDKENSNGHPKESRFVLCLEPKSNPDVTQETQIPFKTPVKVTKTKAALKQHTPGRGEVRVLASALLKEQLHMSPVVHKDYSPCMRVTRSMKSRVGGGKKLGF